MTDIVLGRDIAFIMAENTYWMLFFGFLALSFIIGCMIGYSIAKFQERR